MFPSWWEWRIAEHVGTSDRLLGVQHHPYLFFTSNSLIFQLISKISHLIFQMTNLTASSVSHSLQL